MIIYKKYFKEKLNKLQQDYFNEVIDSYTYKSEISNLILLCDESIIDEVISLILES